MLSFSLKFIKLRNTNVFAFQIVFFLQKKSLTVSNVLTKTRKFCGH